VFALAKMPNLGFIFATTVCSLKFNLTNKSSCSFAIKFELKLEDVYSDLAGFLAQPQQVFEGVLNATHSQFRLKDVCWLCGSARDRCGSMNLP